MEHGDPSQDFIAVVIYPHREVEQKCLQPYRFLLDSDQLMRVYLDELEPAAPDQLEMGILEMIGAKPDAGLKKAKSLLPHIRNSRLTPQMQRIMIDFVETVIIYRSLAGRARRWSRCCR